MAALLGAASFVAAGHLPWHWPSAWISEALGGVSTARAATAARVGPRPGADAPSVRHGRASLVLLPRPRLRIEDVEWRNPRAGLTVAAPEVSLDLRLLPLAVAGRPAAETVTLESPVVTVDIGAGAEADAARLLPSAVPTWRTLHVRDGIVTVRRGPDVVSTAHAVGARLDVPAGGAGATLQAQAVWRGAPVTVDASELDAGRLLSTGATPVALMVGGAGVDASFTGALSLAPAPSFRGEAALSIADLGALPLAWRPDPPVSARLAFRATAALRPGRAELTELRGTVGSNSAEGALRVEWWNDGAEPPRGDINGTLAFASLDARDLLERALPHLGLGRDEGFARRLPALVPWDVDLRWSAGTLIWGAQAIQRAAGHVTSGDGRLDLVLNEGEWHGAACKSRVSVAMGPDAVDVRGSAALEWSDAGRWAKALGWADALTAGQGQAQAVLTSRGASLAALQTALEGRVTLAVKSGTLTDPVSRDIGNRIAGAGKTPRRNGALAFDRLVAAGRLERGVLGLTATAENAKTRVTLEGPIDVTQGALRLRGQAQTSDDATRSLGFAVSGPLTAPRARFLEPGASSIP